MFFVGESAAKLVCKSSATNSASTATKEKQETSTGQTDTQIEMPEQGDAKPEANMPVEVMGMVGNVDKNVSSNVSGDESVSVSERKETDPVTKQGRADQKEKEQTEKATESKEVTVCNKVIGIWVAVFLGMNAVTIPLCFLVDNKLWLAAR